jgi:hypothetical protein
VGVAKDGTLRGGARTGAGRPKKEEGLKKKPMMRIVAEGIDATIKEIRRVGVTEALMREVAVLSLANLVHACRHGNIKAAMFLLDRVLKQPERQFEDQVQEMSPDQIADYMTRSLVQAGFSEEVARGIVTTLQEAPAPDPPELLHLPAVCGTLTDDGVLIAEFETEDEETDE